ncbi:hypothetical protein, partial [Salmonella sp. s51944]|uniref:hypothetical protein n=1 Tax=Salmonella sp. s51944 TaxID=3159655 RepID=UPI00397EEF96
MELLTDGLNGNARSKQVSDILLKQQVAHRELVLKEGEWFESKLVKLQMPELPVTETPYWELQLRHETNHSEGSKLCLSFNDNLPNIGPDDVLIKVRSANLSQSDVLKHLETDDSDKQDMGSSCSGI